MSSPDTQRLLLWLQTLAEDDDGPRDTLPERLFRAIGWAILATIALLVVVIPAALVASTVVLTLIAGLDWLGRP